MNYATTRLTLDIHSSCAQASFSVKLGDTGRQVSCSLTEQGKSYEPDRGCFAVFTATKPDGTSIYNDCTIYDDGRICFALTGQVTAAEGICECELRIYGKDGELLHSPRFSMVVYAAVLDDGTVESSNEFTALTNLMVETKQLKEECENLIENIRYIYSTDDDDTVKTKLGEFFTARRNGEDTNLTYVLSGSGSSASCDLTVPILYNGKFNVCGSYIAGQVTNYGVNYLVLHGIVFSGDYAVSDGVYAVTSLSRDTTLKLYIPQTNKFVSVDNTAEFTPTGDYNPVHKKYVDDAVGKKFDKAGGTVTGNVRITDVTGTNYIDFSSAAWCGVPAISAGGAAPYLGLVADGVLIGKFTNGIAGSVAIAVQDGNVAVLEPSSLTPVNMIVADPTEKSHAATMKYVDEEIEKIKIPENVVVKGSASGAEVSLDDVSSVQHELKVKVKDNSLIAFPFVGSTTGTGITFTDNGDGTITANGTATDTCFFRLSSDTLPTAIEVGKTYTLSGCPEGGSGTTYNIYIQEANGSVSYTDKGDSVTFTAESKSYKVIIRIYAGTTVENLVFKPVLVEGGVASEFVPYIDPTTVTVYCADSFDSEDAQSAIAREDGTVTGLQSTAPNMALWSEYSKSVNMGDSLRKLYFDTSADITEFLVGLTYPENGYYSDGTVTLLATEGYYICLVAANLSILSNSAVAGYALAAFKVSNSTPTEAKVFYSTTAFDLSSSLKGLEAASAGWQMESTDYFGETTAYYYSSTFEELNGTVVKDIPDGAVRIEVEYNRDIGIALSKIEDALSKLTDGNEVAY